MLPCLRLGRPRGNKKPPCGMRVLSPKAKSCRSNNQNFWPKQIRQDRLTDQVTLGITAQSPFRAPIDKGVYDLDVGSGHPNGATAIEGSFVQRLKSYVIWVQTGVIQVGFYLCHIFFQYERTEKRRPMSKICLVHPPWIKLKKVEEILHFHPRLGYPLGWQSLDIAKGLSPFNKGSNPFPNYVSRNFILYPEPSGPHRPCFTSRSFLYSARTKSSGLYTTPKRPKHCRTLWAPAANRWWLKTFYQRASSTLNLFSYLISSYPDARPDPRFDPLSPHTSTVPCHWLKPGHTIYSCPFKSNSLLDSRVRLSIKFKICPHRSPSSCSSDNLLWS